MCEICWNNAVFQLFSSYLSPQIRWNLIKYVENACWNQLKLFEIFKWKLLKYVETWEVALLKSVEINWNCRLKSVEMNWNCRLKSVEIYSNSRLKMLKQVEFCWRHFNQYQHYWYCGAALQLLVLPAGVLDSSVELATRIQATGGWRCRRWPRRDPRRRGGK